MIIILLILLYLIGYILCFGFTFSYLQKAYPLIAEDDYDADRNFALFISLFSWMGLFVSWFRGSWRYGVKYR
jgi:membrane protease YdiL (CAAX protease family)